jgi:methylmalonyl-CoA mutase C-terminal domain/subunit
MAKGRIAIAMLGLDQHELGAIAVARLLRDAGMEVVYAGRFNTPQSIVQTAIDEDVDVIGISCHSWEFVDYTPELMALIAAKGVDVPVVLGGSVITASDAQQMKQQGVAAVFGAGSPSDGIVSTIAELVSARQRRIHVA